LKFISTYSIQKKLRLTFLLLWSSSVVVTTWVAFTLTDHVAGVSLDRILKDDALALASQVRWEGDNPKFGVDIKTADSMIFDSLSTSHFSVITKAGEVIAGDFETKRLNINLNRPLSEPVFFDLSSMSNPMRVVGVTFQNVSKDHFVWVFVAEPQSKRTKISRELASAIFLPALCLTFIVVPLIFLGIRVGLEPANAISLAVSARGIDDLSPIGLEQVPDELKGVIGHINDLLLRLQEAIAHERRFISDAAHQLRTPVAGIKLLSDDLARTYRADPAQAPDAEVLEQLQAVATRAAHLVKQLLNLARTDRSGQEQDARFAVSNVLESVFGVWKDMFNRSSKTLSLSSLPLGLEEVSLQGDSTLLGEAIGNLLDNALRYGGNHIALTVELLHQQVKIKVFDDGVGLSEEEISNVMTPFWRGSGSHHVEGAGLGLSIASNVVHKMGGSIAIVSRPQVSGTEVVISLPMQALH
jgi:two-component system sensor histidine kinase TctE